MNISILQTRITARLTNRVRNRVLNRVREQVQNPTSTLLILRIVIPIQDGWSRGLKVTPYPGYAGAYPGQKFAYPYPYTRLAKFLSQIFVTRNMSDQ